MKIILDTYAWVEYFLGTEKGEMVQSYFNNDLLTPKFVLMELSYKCYNVGMDFKKLLLFIKSKSQIVDISEEMIINFGNFYNQLHLQNKDIGFVDVSIFTLAHFYGTKIITGDNHFKNFDNVIFLS